MKTIYREIITADGHEATSFDIITNKGSAHGVYIKKENRIMIHLVTAQHGLKGLMNVLVNKFKTNKLTFSPLITDGIKNKVRGTIKIIPANAENNPYGESFEILETEWRA